MKQYLRCMADIATKKQWLSEACREGVGNRWENGRTGFGRKEIESRKWEKGDRGRDSGLGSGRKEAGCESKEAGSGNNLEKRDAN